MRERGLGAVGLRRFMARVGDALGGIDLTPLERQGSIPMDAATLGSLADRLRFATDKADEWLARAHVAEAKAETFSHLHAEANERVHALTAAVHALTQQVASAEGVPEGEWAAGEDSPVDTGAIQVTQGSLLDPLARAEARLRAATEEPGAAGVAPGVEVEQPVRPPSALESASAACGKHWPKARPECPLCESEESHE